MKKAKMERGDRGSCWWSSSKCRLYWAHNYEERVEVKRTKWLFPIGTGAVSIHLRSILYTIDIRRKENTFLQPVQKWFEIGMVFFFSLLLGQAIPPICLIRYYKRFIVLDSRVCEKYHTKRTHELILNRLNVFRITMCPIVGLVITSKLEHTRHIVRVRFRLSNKNQPSLYWKWKQQRGKYHLRSTNTLLFGAVRWRSNSRTLPGHFNRYVYKQRSLNNFVNKTLMLGFEQFIYVEDRR